MERRAFLQLLCIGMGIATAAPAKALPAIGSLASPDPAPAPQPGVARPKDLDDAKVEKAWYGHWRRVNRRHYRRVSRRVYRRRYW